MWIDITKIIQTLDLYWWFFHYWLISIEKSKLRPLIESVQERQPQSIGYTVSEENPMKLSETFTLCEPFPNRGPQPSTYSHHIVYLLSSEPNCATDVEDLIGQDENSGSRWRREASLTDFSRSKKKISLSLVF